jgi:hypothetical protein
MSFKKVTEALNESATLVVSELGKNLDESNTHASGSLSKSIKYKMFTRGNKIGYDITMNDYYEAVDKGRGPTKNNGNGALRRNIEKWLTYPNVKAKLKGGNDSDFKNPQGLAYVIARKIHEKGTEGNDFFTDVVDDSQFIRRLNNDILDAAMLDAEAVLEEAFSTIQTG